jgi:hypothetical protein
MGPQDFFRIGASVEALDSNGVQGARIVELDRELDGTAAHFAIFDVFALAGSQVDACFEAFTAIGALDGDEFLGLYAGAGGVGFEYGFQAIELVDVTVGAAGYAAAEGVHLW